MPESIRINPDAAVKAIVAACYPAYRGRKFRLQEQTKPMSVRSYWEGGSRDFFTFYALDTRAIVPMPAQSAFDPKLPGADCVTLPDGILCVEHSIFMGKDSGITIHANPANMPRLLAATV